MQVHYYVHYLPYRTPIIFWISSHYLIFWNLEEASLFWSSSFSLQKPSHIWVVPLFNVALKPNSLEFILMVVTLVCDPLPFALWVVCEEFIPLCVCTPQNLSSSSLCLHDLCPLLYLLEL
jgi:hypothetical protein